MCTATKLSPNALPSIATFNKYRLTRTDVEDTAKHTFYLQHTTQVMQSCFDDFYIRFWSGNYIIDQMKNGVITDANGNSFHVIFADTLTRGKIIQWNEIERKTGKPNSQYMLSFRKPKAEFGLSNYVIIKVTYINIGINQ